MTDVVLDIDGLDTVFDSPGGPVTATRRVSLRVRRGEIVALVGESGSGKSVTSLAALRLLPPTARHPSGAVRVGDDDVLSLSPRGMRSVRGRRIGMVFQEAMSALNPVLRVGEQVAEVLRVHQGLTPSAAWAEALRCLDEVGLPDPPAIARRYPHELSGGQQQRVVIAGALAANPDVLVADEPTTALDVLVQRQILDLLAAARDRRGMGVLFITHDLGLLPGFADRVAVMRGGEIVEEGDTATLMAAPGHAYTRALLAAQPDRMSPRMPPPMHPGATVDVDASFAQRAALVPALHLRGLHVTWPGRGWGWRQGPPVHAVSDVDLDLPRGHTLGLVGASGCGKSSLARALVGLAPWHAAEAMLGDAPLAPLRDAPRSAAAQALRRRLQVVFQDPAGALDPRQRVGDALVEVQEAHGLGRDRRDRIDRAAALFEEVDLSADLLARFPHALSGGQKQRVGIARALAVDPEVIVLDESVSALDVSVAATVLALLRDLQDRRGLSYLFVSHDLAVVRAMAHDVLVMDGGRVVERGTAEAVWRGPAHPTTIALLEAAAGPRA